MVTERDGPGEPRIDFKDAYYIKLGRKGIWEASSISKSRLRFGWNNQSLDDINNARWDIIRDQLSHEHRGKSKVATRDSNALQRICESTPQDVWITFFDSKLWWCRVGEAPIGEDSVSRYRELQKGWSCSDLNGEPLHINRLPGDLSKTQAFRGTVCRVRAKESLWRVLNHEPSREYEQIDSARKELAGTVEGGIRKLHWKDFETFVDLLFRQSGRRRVSLLGQTMKYADIELEDPITLDRYQVQVKSQASKSDFDDFARAFRGLEFKRLYFAVHSPASDLMGRGVHSRIDRIEFLGPDRLAEIAVNLGMVEWLMHHIK